MCAKCQLSIHIIQSSGSSRCCWCQVPLPLCCDPADIKRGAISLQNSASKCDPTSSSSFFRKKCAVSKLHLRKNSTITHSVFSLFWWLALKLTGAAVGLFGGGVFLADPEDAILPNLPASPAHTLTGQPESPTL